MGRQIRKVYPWMGMVESHLGSNMYVMRMYRWNTYHSHPTMRAGHPFKTRGTGRLPIGLLYTPDILRYAIPFPIAFVPTDPKFNPRTKNNKKQCCGGRRNPKLANAGEFKIDSNCQKAVMNYNNCLINNRQATENCFYYLNYLNTGCKKDLVA